MATDFPTIDMPIALMDEEKESGDQNHDKSWIPRFGGTALRYAG